MKTLTIYHTNDIHSNYAFLKKVHAYLKANRKPEELYLDSGDFTDLKDEIVQADMGYSAFGLMELCGLDLITVGNNEADLGHDGLARCATRGRIVSANITDNAGNALPDLPACRIFERLGKRFLVLGLSPFYTPAMTENGFNNFTSMNNLLTQEPIAAARKALDSVNEPRDFCILLSHSGNPVDAEIRKALPEADLILGGHFHQTISLGDYNETGKGEHLGKIVLGISDDRIEILENVNLDLPEVPDGEFDEKLAEMYAYADSALSRELPVSEELPFDPFRESPLTNFICDCLMGVFDADLALMHAGISECALTRPVSKKSLLHTFPSKLNPTLFPVTGQALLDAALLSLDAEHIRGDGRGMGFRGRVLGTLGFSSNVRVTREPFGMSIDGVPVDPEKTYRLVADDYLQRGTGYPSLAVPDELCSYHRWFIRDMVENFLTDREMFEKAKIRRE